jgi:hypothetical protein
MRAEADYGMTDLAHNTSRYHGDEVLLVRFFSHPKKNLAKSQEEGRPIFEDTDYIEIMQPGNKDSIVRRPASDRDKDRFAEHYRRYQARQTEDHIEGTLLEEWPAISRAQCEELKFLNIRTVEQLAGLSDSNAQNIMGIQNLKAKAKQYLEAAKDNATAERFAALEAENEEMKAALKRMAEEAVADKPKRGRPRKTEAPEGTEEG